MTQEEKDLLLKDICSRLPYGVKGINKGGFVTDPSDWYCGFVRLSQELENRICYSDWRPYLFPLSSITEEQKRDLTNLFNCTVVITEWEIVFPNYYDSNMDNWNKVFNWCYKNHFDYRGLIPMGLAIDATNLNIY